MVYRKAYAKINLALDVTGRRPDGYHEVRMIMQTVDIYDEITIEKTESGIELTTDREGLSTGEDNLICKAVSLLKEICGIKEGVRIHLKKNIPIAAGLAGGSTDAASALKGLNELFSLGLDEGKLRKIGVQIGADVPYCIMGGCVLAEGIGEKLTRLPDAPDCILLVSKPDLDVSTGTVYKNLDALDHYVHPDVDGMLQAIQQENLDKIASRLGNVLEEVTIPEYPIVGKIKDVMLQSGAKGSLMSGSGPSVFGIFSSEKEAVAAYERMQALGLAGQNFITNWKNAF